MFLKFGPLIIALSWVLGCGTAGQQLQQQPDTRAAGTAEQEKAVGEKQVDESIPLHNTLKWSTASEVENFGFDIYRSTSEDGPFEKMTSEPIPGAGTIDEPQHYVWEDDAIEAGVDYYYYIESISYGGVRERFSPIIRAPAKSAP